MSSPDFCLRSLSERPGRKMFSEVLLHLRSHHRGCGRTGYLTPAIDKYASDNQQQHLALSTSPPFWSMCMICVVGLGVAYPLLLTDRSQTSRKSHSRVTKTKLGQVATPLHDEPTRCRTKLMSFEQCKLKISHVCALLIAYETLLVALHFGSVAPLSVFPDRFIQDCKNHIWRHLILRRVLFRLIQHTHAIRSEHLQAAEECRVSIQPSTGTKTGNCDDRHLQPRIFTKQTKCERI